jgi:hypothetical protein
VLQGFGLRVAGNSKGKSNQTAQPKRRSHPTAQPKQGGYWVIGLLRYWVIAKKPELG